MGKYTALQVRHDFGRIEVWRNTGDEPWFVSEYPDEGEPGYPGHTYSRQRDEIPASVPDEPQALVDWVIAKARPSTELPQASTAARTVVETVTHHDSPPPSRS